MKALALGLLLLAALIYVLAVFMGPRHAAWGYVAAAAEAAMIGALADWFAVVALFRHPLGLPIPHTAIIAANKDRLGDQLARFLNDHFLTTEHVQRALARWDLGAQLGRWLVDPVSARRVALWLLQAAPTLLAGLDRSAVREAVARLAQRLLREVNMSVLGSQALGALTAHGHHQQWLNGLLSQLSNWAEQEPVQERLTDAIAIELKQLKYLGLDQVAARLATRKLVAALTRALSEVADDPQHELRQRFDGWVAESIEQLQTDPDWQAQVAQWRDAWLDQPQWNVPVEAWWHELLQTLQADAQKGGGLLPGRIDRLVQAAGQQVLDDAALRQTINQQGQIALLRVLEDSREGVVDFVAQRVRAWDAAEMSDVLERHIGRDLQFIRINGTLVGALVGLALHALTMAALKLPAVQGWMQL
jgi:uncharacterized membrane-anchored protein YjiN (DUF445 family)